jgi:transposase
MRLVQEMTFDQIAENLMISSSSVRRIVDLYSTTGDILPREQKHGPCRLLRNDEEEMILEWILDKPGIYLDELQARLHDHTGLLVSITTIYNVIHRAGFTFKRIKQVVQAQDELRRCLFMKEMLHLDPEMIVWIDETGSDHRQSMRTHGRHLRGLTPYDNVISVRGNRLSTIAAMSTRGIEDIAIHDGTINGEKFTRFIVNSVLPEMQPFDGSNPRSVLVLDNASIHHVEEVQDAVHTHGCIIRYLPPYSPDLNPLEEVFAQVKRFLKRNCLAYHCTSNPRVLLTAAFAFVSSTDCNNYITHAGYM